MTLQHLEHAARMLQRFVALRRLHALRFAAAIFFLTSFVLAVSGRAILRLRAGVEPRLRVVLFPIPSGEEAVQLFSVAQVVAQNRRRVRVGHDVIAEPAIVVDRVVDHRAEKREIASGAQRQPVVGHRRRPIESRIDVNDLRAVFLARLDGPLKSDGMVFRHRRSHDQNGVGVCEVLLRGGGAAAPE